MRRAWRANDRPADFNDAQNREHPMFTYVKDDEHEAWHAPSVNQKTLQYLKPKTHKTVGLEIDWYNSDDAAEFRENWEFKDPKMSRYYRYVRRKN